MRNKDNQLFIQSILLACLCFFLMGCSTSTNKETKLEPIEMIVGALQGVWNNRAQFEAAPANLSALTVPPSRA